MPMPHSPLHRRRYNPENRHTLEEYVQMQCRDHGYDLEANLALLKLYQFNPGKFRLDVSRVNSLVKLQSEISARCFVDRRPDHVEGSDEPASFRLCLLQGAAQSGKPRRAGHQERARE